MSPRAFGLTLLLALPAALSLDPGGGDPLRPRAAEAAVSIQLSLDELVSTASFVVVATAVERRSQWEVLGGARRIVTYTRLAVETTVAGEPQHDVWVRTLGGVVDTIGQHVSGDARIAIGSRSMLFLTRADTAVVVSGMAQGHYPVIDAAEAGGARRLTASPDAGTVLPRPGPTISAREALVGATVDAAADTVARAWKGRRAPK